MSAPLLPFRPASDCPKCAGEQVTLTYHSTGLAGSPCWPETSVQDRVFVPHLCKHCLRCGFGWCEQTADYAGEDPEEDVMPIRKTAASGQVLGTEGDGIAKTAAADAPWAAEDEDALTAENAVDQLES